MHRVLVLVLAVACALGLTGCKEIGLAPHEPDTDAVKVDETDLDGPRFVIVQHVLVAYEGAGIPGVTRDLEKAERVARNVERAALEGRPFDELIRLYTDDSGSPGSLKILNWGVRRTSPDDLERGSLVKDFHDACFSMAVDEIRLVPYDASGSPFGWHVIKRIE